MERKTRTERTRVAGIIMASGFSRRMGADKLLMEIGGKAMVQRVIEAALASRLCECVAVCRDQRVAQIARNAGMRAEINHNAAAGQSESIKLGIRALSRGCAFDGYMFIPADMPFIKNGIIDTVVECFAQNPDCIAVPMYEGNQASPVIFPSCMRGELLKLEGDNGGRTLIESHKGRVVAVEIGHSLCGIDIDTAEEYEALKELETD